MAVNKFRHYRNNGLYAYIEVDVSFLGMDVPVGFPWSTKPDGSQRKFRRYSVRVDKSIDGTKALVMLAGKHRVARRPNRVRDVDHTRWVDFLQPLGYGRPKWITLKEFTAKVQDPEGEYQSLI